MRAEAFSILPTQGGAARAALLRQVLAAARKASARSMGGERAAAEGFCREALKPRLAEAGGWLGWLGLGSGSREVGEVRISAAVGELQSRGIASPASLGRRTDMSWNCDAGGIGGATQRSSPCGRQRGQQSGGEGLRASQLLQPNAFTLQHPLRGLALGVALSCICPKG